jgi:hypothetical protein
MHVYRGKDKTGIKKTRSKSQISNPKEKQKINSFKIDKNLRFGI